MWVEVGWWVAVAGLYGVCCWALWVLRRDRGRKAVEIEELQGHISELIEFGMRERRAADREREALEEFHRLELEWYRLRAERDSSRSSASRSGGSPGGGDDISIRVESRRLDEQIAEHREHSDSCRSSSSDWTEDWIRSLRVSE